MTLNNNTKMTSAAYKGWFNRLVIVLAHVALAPVWIMLWVIIPLRFGSTTEALYFTDSSEWERIKFL